MNNAYPPQYPIHPPSFQSQTGGYPSPSPQYRAPYPSNVQGPPGPGYVPPRHANPPYPTGGKYTSSHRVLVRPYSVQKWIELFNMTKTMR